MKRFLFLFIFSFALYCSSQTSIVPTLTEAWGVVQKQLSLSANRHIEVLAKTSLIKANSSIKAMNTIIVSPNEDCWLFFVDDLPNANWGHPCRYIFLGSISKRLYVKNSNFPPSIDDMQLLQESEFTKARVDRKVLSKLAYTKKTPLVSTPARHHYAVIISGGGNLGSNWYRYWNDCAFIYSTLVDRYLYPRENIFVIMSDGTSPQIDRRLGFEEYDSSPLDLNNDGHNDVQYSATKDNIKLVFNLLAKKINPSDELLIFTTDHGDAISIPEKKAKMILWNGEEITDTEFAAEVKKINAKKIAICMEQCFSGAFVDDLEGENRIITTACAHNEVSYSTYSGDYDEFVYHWISAFAKEKPNGEKVFGDQDGDNRINFFEAFDYGAKTDKRNEHPQFSSRPMSIGRETFLEEKSSESCGSFSGTLEQESCLYYNVQHPKIPKRMLYEGTPYFVHQGCNVRLESDCFKGKKKLNYTGITPDYIYQSSNGTINFLLPIGTGGIPFHLEVQNEDGSGYKFLFFTISNNRSKSNTNGLQVESSRNKINISLKKQSPLDASLHMLVDIYSVQSGMKKETIVLKDSEYLIDTSHWEKGTYILRSVVNGEVWEEKVMVK